MKKNCRNIKVKKANNKNLGTTQILFEADKDGVGGSLFLKFCLENGET